jgi:hypothetical protein
MSQKPKQVDLSKPRAVIVTLRFVPELKELGEEAAKNERRSFTSLMEHLLVEHLRAKGYMK